jgi:NADPH:quinone reductase-like Zn-dependent oxidoreductase
VRACALNHLDLWQRRGLPRVTIPLPHIAGSDVAGDLVVSASPHPPPGRRVMLQPGISSGRCPACLEGRDNECPSYEVLGYGNHPGGYAESVTAPLQNLVSIPDGIDVVRAAAFALTFLTAWHMLMTRAGSSGARTCSCWRPAAGWGRRRFR